MITVKLSGGLGNNLFQIAAAYALAMDNNTVCAFDLNSLITPRGTTAMLYKDTLFKRVPLLHGGWVARNHYKEPEFAYRKIPYKRDIHLVGYFASEEYFKHWAGYICRLFMDDFILKRLKVRHGEKLTNSVSLHVRRGDYLFLNDTYIQLPMSYYRKALAIIENKAKVDNIFVFSDDMEWCLDNLKDPRMIFIDGYRDDYDLMLMSLCNHNIIANSSFSWWGAYLNDNTSKIVVSPAEWFVCGGGTNTEGRPNNSKHLNCENWIQI